jgi:hypothetical protein
MNEQDALQRAADEARDAAVRARELADLLEDYASCLNDPSLQGRAGELHMIIGGRVRTLRKALTDSDDWVERSGRSV